MNRKQARAVQERDVDEIDLSAVCVDRKLLSRKRYDPDKDEDLPELMDSIRMHGLLQPLVLGVSGRLGGKYRITLFAGLRRLEACRRLGMRRIPASIAGQMVVLVDTEARP